MTEKTLNEYEAALSFNLSPTLLRWLTVYSIIDNHKLEYIEQDELYYFKHSDLIKFNRKMEGKWPITPKGKRPPIPEGIMREIKAEARFACPVCNRNVGEVAHIDPVSVTRCNHPKNLIFLCPNHHTEFDTGFIPDNITKEDVLIFKKGLQIFQRGIWKTQGNTIKTYLGALNAAISLLSIPKSVTANIPDSMYKNTLVKIINSAPKNTTKVINPEDVDDVNLLKQKAESYIEENIEDICPICNGHGIIFTDELCPVCQGSGELDAQTKANIELTDYNLVECQLCKGTGDFEINHCPACDSNGQVFKVFADNHDWSMYNLIECQLCKGSGDFENNDCPACDSNGQVFKVFADNHDWSMYNLVECQLCKGSGDFENNDCPACDSNGQVFKEFADNHDWSMYNL